MGGGVIEGHDQSTGYTIGYPVRGGNDMVTKKVVCLLILYCFIATTFSIGVFVFSYGEPILGKDISNSEQFKHKSYAYSSFVKCGGYVPRFYKEGDLLVFESQ